MTSGGRGPSAGDAGPGATPRALGVGLIGFGYAAATFHAPLIDATPGLALRAVCTSDPARVQRARTGAAAVAVVAEPAALWTRHDIDLVVIPTPNATHFPLARDALRAGRHVVVDKPFTLDADEARSLCALAETRGRVLSVFHNRRWDGDFLSARGLLAAGRLGTVTEAALHFDRFRPQVRDRWREGAGPGGGLWLDLGAHLVDQALQLFGWPEAIDADLAALRPGAQADDHFCARLRWPGGLRATLAASMLMALPRPRMALHGTQGSWVKHGLDAQEDQLKAGLRPGAPGFGIDSSAGTLTVAAGADGGSELTTVAWPNPSGAYTAYYAGVRDAIHGAGPNPVPATEALRVMTLLDLGRRSHRERRELPAGPDPGVRPLR